MKFGGNPCRDVDTLGFYTNTHTYTNEIIYYINIFIYIYINTRRTAANVRAATEKDKSNEIFRSSPPQVGTWSFKPNKLTIKAY